MEQFSYHFITTMFHSIWQSALLLTVYYFLLFVHPKAAPLFKRNLLLAFSAAQLAVSFFTFMVVSSQPSLALLAELSFTLNQSFQNSFIQNNALLIGFAYCCTVLFRLSNSFFPWTRFKSNYTKSVLKPSLDIRLFTQSKAHHFGINKKVFIWYSKNISTPMTFGFFKPVILLPFALVNQLTLEQTEALIVHELTHISHNDYLLNWLLLIAESLYFFNPFMLIMAKKIKTEREKSCDVQVLQFKYAPILYAETLLKTAQYQQYHLSLQMAAVTGKKQLLQRIHFFSNPKNLEFSAGRGFITTVSAIVIVGVNILLPGLSVNNKPVIDTVTPLFTTAKPDKITTESFAVKTIASNPLKKEVIEVSTSVNLSAGKNKASDKARDISVTFKPIPAAGDADFYPIPVSNKETLVEGKEISISEEDSEGNKITAVYNAILIDGVWTLQPVYMLKHKPVKSDSIKALKDSVLQIFPAIQ
jgi:beta-lactamase regulating signal transducer with metallopeptidase domain